MSLKFYFIAEKLINKKTFLHPDYLSEYYEYLKHKFPVDFGLVSVPTIRSLVNQLRKWIYYIEYKSVYPSKFVHCFRRPSIHNVDWSQIRLPSDNYTDVMGVIYLSILSTLQTFFFSIVYCFITWLRTSRILRKRSEYTISAVTCIWKTNPALSSNIWLSAGRTV